MSRQLLLPLPECQAADRGGCTRFCNRCNAAKETNGPCTQCGSPEFRIVKERNQCLLTAEPRGREPNCY